MTTKSIRTAGYVVSVLGILLHLYLTFFNTNTEILFHRIVPVLNCAPYLVCLVLLRVLKKPMLPLCAGIIILLIDLYLFRGYFLSSSTYRFAIVELYLIVFKIILVVPLGCLIGFFVDKFMKRHAAA